MKCPRCNSENLRKSGYSETGARRFYCKDCKRKFTEGSDYSNIKVESVNPVKVEKKEKPKVLVVKKETKTCLLCGSNHTKKSGKKADGTQVYYCHDCNHIFYNGINEPKEPKEPTFNKDCPECENGKATKLNIDEKGRQLYKCTKCGCEFIPKGFKFVTNEQKDLIKEYLEKGMTKQEISEELELSYKTIQRYTEGMELTWKKEQEERIQKENAEKLAAKLQAEKEKEEELRIQKLNQRREEATEIVEKFKKTVEMISEENDKSIRYLISKYVNSSMSLDEFECLFNDVKIQIEKEYVEYQNSLKEKSEQERIQEEKERLESIQYDILHGKSLENISTLYNTPLSKIKEIANPLLENESITEQQEKMIVQYGIMLKVPIDYLAEYVPCSYAMCDRILNKWKNKEIKVRANAKEKVKLPKAEKV